LAAARIRLLVFGSLLCFAIQAAAARNNVSAVMIFGCAPRSRSAFLIATCGPGFQLPIPILAPELPTVFPAERAACVSSQVATDFLSLGVHCHFPPFSTHKADLSLDRLYVGVLIFPLGARGK
jgi:hypothetical protein